MILGMLIAASTLLHVILIAIGSGLIVVGGMFASHRLPGATAFLFTTVSTGVTLVAMVKLLRSAISLPSEVKERRSY